MLFSMANTENLENVLRSMARLDPDDTPELLDHTLQALHEFYAEQRIREAGGGASDGNVAPSFTENWQLSQFWYDEETSNALAKEAIRVAGPSGKIALISSPSLYNAVKRVSPDSRVTLLEYDRRFQIFGNDYIFYNYEEPLDIPQELEGEFDVVLADPPFLSEECLTKTADTIKFLAKNKIIVCTGAVMEGLATSLLDLSKANFEPRHENNLANEFACFSNYDIDEHILS